MIHGSCMEHRHWAVFLCHPLNIHGVGEGNEGPGWSLPAAGINAGISAGIGAGIDAGIGAGIGAGISLQMGAEAHTEHPAPSPAKAQGTNLGTHHTVKALCPAQT